MTKKDLKEVLKIASNKDVEVIPIRFSYYGHKLKISGIDYTDKDSALKALEGGKSKGSKLS